MPKLNMQTLTDATIRLFDGEEWPALNAACGGDGVMLMIDMHGMDGRHAEVFLDSEAAAALKAALP